MTTEQLIAFESYVKKYADAGVHIKIINDPADAIKLELDLYYDSQILDETGKRLDGTDDQPVQNAINVYLNDLEFNGIYSNMRLIDSIQNVEGILISELKYAGSCYPPYTEFKKINAYEVAHAGYYKVSEQNLQLNFITYEE